MLMSLKRFWREDEGQDLAEYGLVLTLVALSAMAAMKSFASAVSAMFNNASTTLS